MSRPLSANPKRNTQAAEFHRRVFAAHGKRCYFCGGAATDAMHLIGRAHLGPHRYACPEENGRPGCRKCHDTKGWLSINFALRDRRAAVRALNKVLTVKLESP
jgi:predicted restriction endonuclease